MRYSHSQLTLNASTSSYILYGEKFLWDKLLVVSWTYFKLQNFNREKLTTMKAIPFTCNRYGEVLHAFVQWQCYSIVFLVAWRRYILILLAPVLHRFSQCGGEEHVGRVSWRWETRPLCQAVTLVPNVKARFYSTICTIASTQNLLAIMNALTAETTLRVVGLWLSKCRTMKNFCLMSILNYKEGNI